MLQKTFKNTASKPVTSRLTGPSCQLREDELHLARRQQYNALLQHMVCVGGLHRLPYMAVECPRQRQPASRVGNFQGCLQYAAAML